ncbi:hypothetical protein EXVG_00115 [Emiliania huxleyi virus 202]|nr:hypothetical protein EXVG_00115 [Emiliania huxleyi virus 202]AHA54427.1 putative membrane protein [Emiliania huxleyi virus 18]AHA55467.1 putative membrane protein [Emiliania huxleyi virus 156]
MSNVQKLVRYYKEYVSEYTISILTNMKDHKDADILAESYINIIRNANYKQIIAEHQATLYKNAFTPMCMDNLSLRIDLDKVTAVVAQLKRDIDEQKSIITELRSTIAEQNSTIAGQNSTIAGQNSTIAEQNSTIAKLNYKYSVLVHVNIASFICIFTHYLYIVLNRY